MQHKSIHLSACNYFSFLNCHVHADALSDTCGFREVKLSCFETKEYWEKSVLHSKSRHHLFMQANSPHSLLYQAKDTYQQSAGHATQYQPLPKLLKLISRHKLSAKLQITVTV